MAKLALHQLMASDAKIAVLMQKCPAKYEYTARPETQRNFSAVWGQKNNFFRRIFMAKLVTPIIGLAVVVALAMVAVFGAMSLTNPASTAMGVKVVPRLEIKTLEFGPVLAGGAFTDEIGCIGGWDRLLESAG